MYTTEACWNAAHQYFIRNTKFLTVTKFTYRIIIYHKMICVYHVIKIQQYTFLLLTLIF